MMVSFGETLTLEEFAALSNLLLPAFAQIPASLPPPDDILIN